MTESPMAFQLSADPNFHYEALRSLGLVRYFGGDIREQLDILPKIPPGDVEAWYREWHSLALRVLSTIDENKISSYSPVTLKDVYFRASHYFFMADFFLHGNTSDPRLYQSWQLWREYYDKANSFLPIPGQHATVATPYGFELPIIVYRAPQASMSKPAPTLLVGGGFDSNYEETMHAFGFGALERGFNVVLYEGPGQPTLIHRQHVGFIHDWEKAVTPIIDYLVDHGSKEFSFIDTSKIGLVGMSLGGYLSARAAAFEPRLAALMCVDGAWSLPGACSKLLPDVWAAWEGGDNAGADEFIASSTEGWSTGSRWVHDHLRFSFCSDSGTEIFQRISQFTLDGVAEKIKMPAFIGDAVDEIFFIDQPAHVAQKIGSNATLVKFGRDQAASAHCQSGALNYLNQEMLEWFGNVVRPKKV